MELESGRVEEIPETETELPPQLAPALSGERQEAAERMSAIVERVGLHEREAASQPSVALDTLSEGELRSWIADRRVIRGETSDEGLTASLATIAEEVDLVGAEVARDGGRALDITASQRDALATLHRDAMDHLDITWNATGGAPRSIDGALYLARGVDAGVVADDYLRSAWPMLGRLLEADEWDTLEPVAEGDARLGSLKSIVFRRIRDGVPMPQNAIEVFVSTETHALGAGLVERLQIEWDREVPPPAHFISEEEALLLAEDALGVDLRAENSADTDLRVRCMDTPGARRCGPMWRVYWSGRAGTERWDESGAPHRDDAVYLDAESGEIVFQQEESPHYSGSVNVTTNYAYDTSDVIRDYRYARLTSGASGYTLDSNGYYNWTPSSSAAQVGLNSTINPILQHEQTYSCTYVAEPFSSNITLGITANILAAPNTTTARRTNVLMWNWYQYMFDVVKTGFANQAELPSKLWYNAAPSTFAGGGQFFPCNGTTQIGALGIAAGNDSFALREDAVHEWMHSVEWCTQTVGAGCGWAGGVNQAIGNSWHTHADVVAAWFDGFSRNRSGGGSHRYEKYHGINAANDLVVHDEEIEGTATIASGCTVTGTYACAGNEACWADADGKPRCMRRASSVAQCQSIFLGQQPYVDLQPYGLQAGSSTPINICVSNDYTNGNLWHVVGQQLLFTGGYYGLQPIFGANRFLDKARRFTQTSNNFHDVFGQYGDAYTISDAFHKASTESFAWLDDTTNLPQQAQIIRPPQPSLTFGTGGPTGTALAFQGNNDVDYFLMPADAFSTYEIQTTTGSTSVDLCIEIYSWASGAFVSSSSGCTNGASTPAARNALVNVSLQGQILIRVYNVLGLPGVYDLRLKNLTSDYPTSLYTPLVAQPLSPGGVALSAKFETTTGADVFRYDRPLGATGPITFAAAGVSPAPTVNVYFTTGTAVPPPTGSPLFTGTGSTTVASPMAGHYYVRVINNGAAAGSTYTIQANTSCSNCNESGTYSSPRPLPTTRGGLVWNAIDTGSGSTEHPDWTDCSNGVTCDWYSTTLAENERLTATLYKVYDNDCDLELAVYGPSDMVYFQGGGSDRYPAVLDQNGSMESRGAQLTFVANHAGLHRVRVRSTGSDSCPRYEMAVTQGAVESFVRPAVH